MKPDGSFYTDEEMSAGGAFGQDPAPVPKGADLHVRMALSCLEELEPEAMRRKARTVRNFNEHMERESQLSAARVSLDRALDILTKHRSLPSST
jgi:hypothetical protein